MELIQGERMKIEKTKLTKPPRMVIYGQHGIGKSTFAAHAPQVVFIQTEDGLDALGVDAFPLARSFEEVVSALTYLATQQHNFRSVAIDSLDWLEKLIFRHVCEVAKVSDIAQLPYGRGYVAAENLWKEVLDLLTTLRESKKMYVILLAHAQIQKFEDPERENYDRYNLDLQKKGAGLVCEFADIIGYCSYKISTVSKDSGFGQTVTKAKTTGERVLNLEERPAFTAKNRYRLPAQIPLSWPALMAELKAGMVAVNGAGSLAGAPTPGNLAQAATEHEAGKAKRAREKAFPDLTLTEKGAN